MHPIETFYTSSLLAADYPILTINDHDIRGSIELLAYIIANKKCVYRLYVLVLV